MRDGDRESWRGNQSVREKKKRGGGMAPRGLLPRRYVQLAVTPHRRHRRRQEHQERERDELAREREEVALRT
ncbi:hypothetical protein S83_001852, partial [Arachis hypogaea]